VVCVPKEEGESGACDMLEVRGASGLAEHRRCRKRGVWFRTSLQNFSHTFSGGLNHVALYRIRGFGGPTQHSVCIQVHCVNLVFSRGVYLRCFGLRVSDHERDAFSERICEVHRLVDVVVEVTYRLCR